MSRKSIHPTKHAIERFEERVLPQLPSSQRTIMQKKEEIRHALYELARDIDIEEESNRERGVRVDTFLNLKGNTLIPLTLVINPLRKILLTLYISPNWENIGSQENPTWRFCS